MKQKYYILFNLENQRYYTGKFEREFSAEPSDARLFESMEVLEKFLMSPDPNIVELMEEYDKWEVKTIYATNF